MANRWLVPQRDPGARRSHAGCDRSPASPATGSAGRTSVRERFSSEPGIDFVPDMLRPAGHKKAA
jgi:hypothetical protein